MARTRDKYLYDMLDSSRFVMDLTTGEAIERFNEDRLFRRAIERELQIIGEAMLQLRSIDPQCAASFDEHERIIGFRHVLVHGYDALDPEIVWYIVTDRLPVLARQLQLVLDENQQG